MKVTVDHNSGFCWGVVRTISIAEQEMKNDVRLSSLGPVIHNPREIERLAELGMDVVSTEDFPALRGRTVLIRAHGEPASTYELARKHGVTLVDATCPVVTKVQERIRKYYDKGFQIVIFGKKEHAEVVGLNGQINREGIVIRTVEEISLVDLTRKTVLFSQTTMDKATFRQIAEELRGKIREFEVATFEESAVDFHAKDTICGQVSGRETKLREFAASNDVMIFVAGRNSSNGKVLFDICRDANPLSYFVESVDEVEADWLRGAERVGVSGATSTPQWLMEDVKTAIEQLSTTGVAV
ncbi:MAG: 4-hydroxy-3-methylbut-2-enyl diphosphate reductase [Ignavibacteria bacterium]|nr:4-hydroxy-3-methylbut-2-enyl diphosphate reductase [Ignavibacteria bacterium]